MARISIKVNDAREVWYQTTVQYDITIKNQDYFIRISENPKGVEFFILEDDQWKDLDTSDPIGEAIYDAWMEGYMST